MYFYCPTSRGVLPIVRFYWFSSQLGSNRGIQFYQNLRDFTYRADVTDFSYICFFIFMYGAGLCLLHFKECLRNNIVRLCRKNVGFSMCLRGGAHTFRITLPDHALGAKMMSSAKSPIVSGLLLPERRWLSAPKRRCNIAVFVLYLRNCFLLF